MLSIRWFVSILILFASSGCISTKTSINITPETKTPSIFSTVSETSSEPAFDITPSSNFLTEKKWHRIGEQSPDFADESTSWEFYSEGVYRWTYTSDYQEVIEGAWEITSVSDENGVIFLTRTERIADQTPKFDVLSYTITNNNLLLGELSYQGTFFTLEDVPPNVSETVTISQRDQFFILWNSITAVDWISDSPLPGDPNRYSFMKDGTYKAFFSETECQYSGTWSLIKFDKRSGDIRLRIPVNKCDPRGPRDAFVQEMPVAIKGEKLFLYNTPYLSVPKGGG